MLESKTTMIAEEIQNRLQRNYPKAKIFVKDLTGTEDHFEIHITDSQFENLTHLEGHKKIYSFFKNELKSGEIHALSIKIKNP